MRLLGATGSPKHEERAEDPAGGAPHAARHIVTVASEIFCRRGNLHRQSLMRHADVDGGRSGVVMGTGGLELKASR